MENKRKNGNENIKTGQNENLTLTKMIGFEKYLIIFNNKNIKKEKIKKMKQLENFKLFSYSLKYLEDDSTVAEIIFFENDINNNFEEAEKLFDIIDTLMFTKNAISVYEILEECKKMFDIEKRIIKEEFIIGTMGELCLILKLEKLGIQAHKWFHSNDKMLFDLYANEYKKYIEVKSIQRNDNFINAKIKQISSEREYTILTKVEMKMDDNASLIKDIISELKKYVKQNDFLLEYLDDLLEIILKTPSSNNMKINFEKTIFKIYKCTDLPVIINTDDRITNISYQINTFGIKTYNVEELIELLKN